MFEKKVNSNVEPSSQKSKKSKGCVTLFIIILLVVAIVITGLWFIFSKGNQDNSDNDTILFQTADNEIQSEDQDNESGFSYTGGVLDVSDMVEDVMPSIVSISNTGTEEYEDFFGQTYSEEFESSGTGIIFGQNSDEVFIVTNNHVIEDATEILVTFADEESVTATVKGTDSYADLAVLMVNKDDISESTFSNIRVATFGDSESMEVGDPVVAIGNALGYGQSVTTGIVSALDREVTVDDVTNILLQTDAAINPGNSGGALLNLSGEVIGINSVKYADTDVEGIGYAIPISEAEPIINDIMNKDKVDEEDAAYLGIKGKNITDEASTYYGMPVGVYVTSVTDGEAADQAGISEGDIIVKIDDRTISSTDQLTSVLEYYSAGDEAQITVMVANNGTYEEKILDITFGSK